MHKDITFISFADFDEKVLRAEKLIIVNFWANWCGKCKMIDPMLDEVVEEIGDRATILQVDLDHEPQIAERYPLFHVPALLFFKNGVICDQIIAVVPKNLLLQKIKEHSQ